jgi:uncharacterized protein (TIGR01619 family)
MSLNTSKRHLVPSTENWDYYYCLVDEKPAIISVDLNLVDVVPDAAFPYLFYVSLKVRKPNSDGFPTPTEMVEMCRLEDAIMEYLLPRQCAIFSGRVTTNGSRDLIFYVRNIEAVEILVKSAMKSFSDYSFDCGSKEDSEWDFYIDFLFPNERELNAIYNHRYTAELTKLGDQANQERTVTHTLFFPDENARDNFILKAIDDYFQVESIEVQPSAEKYRWKTVISRADSVDLMHINEVTLKLLDLAKAENGMYEGWVTIPMRLTDAV